MGGNESSHLASRMTKSQVLDQLKPLGALSYSFFRQEHVISAFYHSSSRTTNNEFFSYHTPSQLASLLLGCYEQLDHIPEILETLMKLIIKEQDNKLVLELSYSFDLYAVLADARNVMILTLQQFNPQLFTPFTEAPCPKGPNIPSFDAILKVFQIGLRENFKKLSKNNEFEAVAQHFVNAGPATAFPPPTPEFIPREVGHTEPFSARYVIPHGTSSNGQFLFVLSCDMIQIFPLFNMGSLIAPITRKFEYIFEMNTSLTADKTRIFIYRGDFCYEYQIFDIFQKKMICNTKPVPPGYICYVSDGIVNVRLDGDFSATVTENGKILRKVKLIPGNKPLHPQIPQLFPNTNYSYIPIETNGTFLSFMFRISNNSVVYRVFSLITGKHVHDDVFCSSEFYCSTQTDTINRCHWVVSMTDSAKLGVRRYYFAGSVDPSFIGLSVDKKSKSKKSFKKFLNDMNQMVIHYAGSQVIPKSYLASNIALVEELIEITKKYISLPKLDQAVQILVIILELNLKQYKPTASIRDQVLNLVEVLPQNLAVFLFFNCLQLSLFERTDRAVSLMVDLISKLRNETLMTYALARIESSYVIANISFSKSNKLSDLLPSDTRPENAIPSQLHSLLLIHQRILITISSQYVRRDGFDEIQYRLQKESMTPLDFLNDYSKAILSKFQKALSECQSDVELDSSLILGLLYNFLNLLSSLSTYHVIAQFLTETFSGLLDKINSFILQKSLDINDDSNLANIVRLFLFVYGKFAATLLKGTSLTDFESHFTHLLRSNLDVNETRLMNPELNDIDPKIGKFLSEDSLSAPIMDTIYKKFKPFMHKNLTEELKYLDKLALVTVCKHTNALNELFNIKFPFTPNVKSALDQMLRIRNASRALQQANQTNEIPIKCGMLLKMNVDDESKASEIGEFVISKENVETIVKLLMRQKTRDSLNGLGFSLADSVLSLDQNSLFIEIFTFTLAQLENFDGMSSILKITGGSKEIQIETLFDRILNVIKTRTKSKLILVSYRFFRDCKGLEKIQSKFLNGILSIFVNHNDNYALFALALSLLGQDKKMPKALQSTKQSIMGWLLQSIALEKVQATSEFFNQVREEFWKCPPNLKRILCRTMFRAINSTLLDGSVVKNELTTILKAIGQIFIEFSDIGTANEYIWLLRRILVEKTHAQPILYDLIINADHKDDVIICGIFAVLGGAMESIRPFCNIKSHDNRSSASEFIAVPTSEKTQFFCYNRPFDLNSRPFHLRVSPQNLVYAVSVVKLDLQSFNDFGFILSFFNESFNNLASIRSALYVQVMAHFLQYTEFINKMTPEIMTKLAALPLPFHTIHSTIGGIRSLQALAALQQVNEFNQIMYNQTAYVSFLSPQLKPSKRFTVNFKVSDSTKPYYFGIISDNVERYITRFSVVSVPGGVWFPYNNSGLIKFKSANLSQISFVVDTEKGVFVVEDKELEFPRGETFRVIIAVHKNVTVSISTDNDPFDLNACPSICPHGAITAGNKLSLFESPPMVKNKFKELPKDPSRYPNIKTVVDSLPIGYKVKNNFSQPPDYISIHCGFATHASPQIVAENIAGLFKTIALQYTTVCLMRICSQKPKLIPNPMKLFTLLTIPLEPFSQSQFARRKFPFRFQKVSDHPNSIYYSLENDAINAIKSLLSVEKNIDRLSRCLLQMSESRNLHLLSSPNVNHTYFPPRSFGTVVPVQTQFSIVTVNSFTPYRRGFARIHPSDKNQSLPLVVPNGPTQISVAQEVTNEDLSIFNISAIDNSFAFDTAFEILLILKNLSYVAKSPIQKYTIKSAFANLVIAQSPFVYRYLSEFANFLELQIPPSPFDFSQKYIEKVVVMGGTLRNTDQYENFSSFINQESHVLGSTLYIEISKYFPEFLSVVPDKPTSNICTVPIVSLDPGTIKDGYDEKIRTIRLFSRSYASLVGFPFWEILPYWLRVTGAWRTSSNVKNEADEIDPFAESVTPDVMHISNPTAQRISIHLRSNRGRFSPSSMLMMSSTPDFENSVFINGRALEKSIDITGQHQFLALIDVAGSWSAVRIEFTSWKRYRPPPPEKIDIVTIHDAFVADMAEFAINWTPENTEELIMTLPRYALTEPTFSTTETIAKSCPLTHRFSTNVVVLRALLLHQFNFIRSKFQNAVPRSVWESMKSFVSCEDAADEVVGAIHCGKPDAFPQFTIDRHAAKKLAVEGRGDTSKSIVSQLTVIFHRIDHSLLQCKKRPWKIKFEGELAVDAGGPTRELMTEVAGSIFEPTTELFIPVPNSHRGDGENKDTFVPIDRTGRRAEEFATIGIFLGIVLRTGFAQDLPFAPIIWKYLAHEKIGEIDIYAIDDVLEGQLKIVPQQCEQGAINWTVETWEGQITVLPGHAPNTVVRVEEASQYIHEVIQYRIDTIKRMMKVMRKAFQENVGFKRHPLLSGKLLSRMAQGSSVIATEHLKAITVIADYDGIKDPFIQRFWRSVERFTSDQRRLLLKFITTLTRLPNATINPDFRLQIDKMNTKTPDEQLPTAATCFNRLHLPAYSSDDICTEKILYAIQYCQSMENK